MNKVILIGHVGKDPEVTTLENGNKVCNFSLATSKRYTNKNGDKINQTEWHNVVMWGKLIEIIEKYVKKGSQLCIEGGLETTSWDDKEGNKRYTTKINAAHLEMLGKQQLGEKATGGEEATS